MNFLLGCFIWLLFIAAIECLSNLGINSIGYLGISNTWMYGSNRIIFPDGLCSMPMVTMKHERSWFFGTTGFFSLCCMCCAGLILSFETSCIKLFLNCKCWRVMGLKWFVYLCMFSQLILQMYVWRNCDGFLLLWKEMEVWDYFCFCSFFSLLPLFCYYTNWKSVQNSAELLTRTYSHL